MRPFRPEDVPRLHQILSEPNILRYFPRSDPPGRERVERIITRQLNHWQRHGYGWWALETHDESRLIGWNGLQYLPDTDETEVGYLLSRGYWGRGLATESGRATVRYGFETLGLDTIVGLTHPDNVASGRVLQKLGLTLTRADVYFGDMDVYRYALDRLDYFNRLP